MAKDKKNLTVVGTDNQDNDIFGAFGNDHLTGGSSNDPIIDNDMIGDALNMTDSEGGNDVLTGGNNTGIAVFNDMFGDAALTMTDSVGGNDVLTGGNNTGVFVGNGMVGDAVAQYGGLVYRWERSSNRRKQHRIGRNQ
jgi:hypothetical protein